MRLTQNITPRDQITNETIQKIADLPTIEAGNRRRKLSDLGVNRMSAIRVLNKLLGRRTEQMDGPVVLLGGCW